MPVTDHYPSFTKDNVRFKCNDKKVHALYLNYKSKNGYVGPDDLDVLALFPGGFAREAHINLHVR